jgi:hypothetical protein
MISVENSPTLDAPLIRLLVKQGLNNFFESQTRKSNWM